MRLLMRRACESIVRDPRVIAAADTRDAIDAYRQILASTGQPPDLVVTDLNMPMKAGDLAVNEAGLILTRVIHKTHPEVPIVIVTAVEDSQVHQRCLEVGARQVVLKENFSHRLHLRNAFQRILPEDLLKAL